MSHPDKNQVSLELRFKAVEEGGTILIIYGRR